MGHLTRFLLGVASFLAVAVGHVAHAHDRMPPLETSRDAQERYMRRMIGLYPWTTASGVAHSMGQHIGAEQAFLPGVTEHQEYVTFGAKGPFVTIHIESGEQVKQKVSVIPAGELARLKKETLATLTGLRPGVDESLAEALDRAITERLALLSQSDPRGIMTGMINCLPGRLRGPLFKTASQEELYTKLSETEELTDEALKESFQGAAHKIAPEKLSRAFLLKYLRELLDSEAELVPYLRARWFLSSLAPAALAATGGNHKQLDALVAKSPSESFDINQADEHRAESFFAAILDRVVSPSKDVLRRAKAYLERVERNWRDSEKTFEERVVLVWKPYLTLRELPAYIVAHRSALTGDCGTRDDYPYPYAPAERNFFVFGNNDDVLGYAGTTILKTEGKLTLYVHDVSGQRLSQEVREIACNAFHEVLPHFGVERMTISQTGYCPYPQATGRQVANEYLDAGIRAHFFKFAPAAHGDRPQDNPVSFQFKPQPDRLHNLRVRLEGAAPVVDEKKPEGPGDALKRFLDLTAGQMEQAVKLDFLGIPQDEAERILSIVNNSHRYGVKRYYEELEALFNQYQLKLSEKFIKNNENYFIRGHLSSRDALTNEEHLDRTITFVLAVVRRGQDRDVAYALIKKNPALFAESPKFRAYLEKIPLNGAEQAERVRQLLAAGIDPQVMAPDKERLLAFVKSGDASLVLWAVEQWVDRKLGDFTKEIVEALVGALDNEHHESDELSLRASEYLMGIRTDDPQILRSLSKSVSREDNLEIAYRAAVVLRRNGSTAEEIERLAKKNKDHHVQLLRRIQADGDGEKGEESCRDSVARK